jgi:tRNA pseudouridine55 synthase
MHSAKFINGKRAYEYARKGISKELNPVDIVYRELELLSFGIPETIIRLLCSKGTYVRSFARDLGVALNSGCHLSGLERTAIGSYSLAEAYTIGKFAEFLDQMQQNRK